jgi:hypothetical protein
MDMFDPQLMKITEAQDCIRLIDEMANDKSAFVNNRAIILDAWRDGCMYGLANVSMISIESPLYGLTVKGASTWDLLPCVCIAPKEGHAGIMWVHKRARLRGLGRAFVDQLQITNVVCPFEHSIPFWRACGVFVPEEDQPDAKDGSNDH